MTAEGEAGKEINVEGIRALFGDGSMESVQLPPDLQEKADRLAAAEAASVPASTEKAKSGEVSDSGLDLGQLLVADELVRQEAGRLLFDRNRQSWLVWDSSRFAPSVSGHESEAAKRILRALLPRLKPADAVRMQAWQTLRGVLSHASSDPRIAVLTADLDADPYLLACPGVTVDLRSGKSRGPDPADRITKCAGVAPIEGPYPNFQAFLDQTFGADEDLIGFIQAWIGYCLTGCMSEHIVVLFVGGGGNGKSVLLSLFQRLLGTYSKTTASETFVWSPVERHPADLAALVGARLIVAAEIAEGKTLDDARLKRFSGADPVAARVMRGDWFEFDPQGKIVMAMNALPNLRSVDDAMRRRLRVVPFNHRPARPDPDLLDKLWEEAPQILSWAIRGCLTWQDAGLPLPEAVRAASADFLADQDVFGAWLSDRCTLDREAFTGSASLYESWTAFAEAAGERPGSAKRMGARLRKAGCEADNRRVSGVMTRGWAGIRIGSGEGRA